MELFVIAFRPVFPPTTPSSVPTKTPQELNLRWEGIDLFPNIRFVLPSSPLQEEHLRHITFIPFSLRLAPLEGSDDKSEGVRRYRILCLLCENPTLEFYAGIPVEPREAIGFSGNQLIKENPQVRAWLSEVLKEDRLIRVIESAAMSNIRHLHFERIENFSFSTSTTPKPDELDKEALVHSLPDEILEFDEFILPSYFVVTPFKPAPIKSEARVNLTWEQAMHFTKEEASKHSMANLAEPLKAYLEQHPEFTE
jgi:hypothetical protein